MKKRINEDDYKCKMKSKENIVEFDNLKTWFYTDDGIVKAVDGVSFSIPLGKTVGVVGESGCGKSVTSLSLMRLVAQPHGKIVDGQIRLNMGEYGIDVTKAPLGVMEQLRGQQISMIFQEPMTSLNPVFRIGKQVEEVLILHRHDIDKNKLQQETLELLKLVGISNAEGVYKMYPHELSGGMRQRIVIAMALACHPKLIIADEPTTALDVTIQAQILDLLRDLKDKTKTGIMLITHDLGVIAEMADEVVVMYAGRIVEKGSVFEIFDSPAHPYTLGLLKSKPVIGKNRDALYSISGRVPSQKELGDFCYFSSRCPYKREICMTAYPPETKLTTSHSTYCYRCGEVLKERENT